MDQKSNKNLSLISYCLLISFLYLIPAFSAADSTSADDEITDLLEQAEVYYRAKKFIGEDSDNAYQVYRRVLALDPDNAAGLEAMFNILNIQLEIFEEQVHKYGLFLKAEARGKNVKKELFNSVSDMVASLINCSKVCYGHPFRDPETNELCEKLLQQTRKYRKLKDYYQSGLTN